MENYIAFYREIALEEALDLS